MEINRCRDCYFHKDNFCKIFDRVRDGDTGICRNFAPAKVGTFKGYRFLLEALMEKYGRPQN